ncbi:hypothetical protein [Nonomuraea cavernae]|uniref:hypothetical protein n=1 Tax=Nonomuraea cavernae TaxID=2045107 RepID=UPI0033DD9581
MLWAPSCRLWATCGRVCREGSVNAHHWPIDRTLANEMRELGRHRRRIAELAAGDRLFVPDEVAQILERQRALGLSERMVRIERDIWIIIAAPSPESIHESVATKNAALDDPEFVRPHLPGQRRAVAHQVVDRYVHAPSEVSARRVTPAGAAAMTPLSASMEA